MNFFNEIFEKILYKIFEHFSVTFFNDIFNYPLGSQKTDL